MEVGHMTQPPAAGPPLCSSSSSSSSSINMARRKPAIPSNTVASARNDGEGDEPYSSLYVPAGGDQKRWTLAPNSSWVEHKNGGSNGVPASNSASEPSPPSYQSKISMDPHRHHHESATDVHRVLYQDLAEIMPLLESFMDQHNNKPFARHNAALAFTPSPPPKKEGRTPPKDGLCKRSVAASKDDAFWENASDRHRTSNHKKMAANVVADLQFRIEELEQQVKDKENQLQALQSAREADILCLQTRIDEMQALALEREKDLHTNMTALQDSQDEIVKLHSLLQQAEVEVQVSKSNVDKIRGELHNLQRNVAIFLIRMQAISSSQLEDDHIRSQAGISSDKSTQAKKEDGQTHDLDADASMELVRQKYIACLVAARENPDEELLSLISQLRGQLQSYLMKAAKPSI